MKLSLTEQIKLMMDRKNLTYTEVARRLEMTPQAVRQMIKKGNMTISSLNKLCDAIGVEAEITLKEAEI